MKSFRVKRQFSSGGVIFRPSPRGPEVALISRQGSTVWCLPKGLIEEGESLEETALREVEEETGLKGKLLGKIDAIRYGYVSKEEQAKFFKVVTFFLLRRTGGNTRDHDFEVDEAAWFSIPQALAKLSYPSERKIMRKAAALIRNLEWVKVKRSS